MIFLGCLLVGFALGWWRAARRGGAVADRIQYGLAHGLGLALSVAVAAQLAMLFGIGPG